jgi:predicted nucleic acid-binding protein
MPPGRRRDTLDAVNTQVLAGSDDGTINFDAHAAFAYGRIVSARAPAGRPINRDDAQTAVCCVAFGAALATRNTSDFEGIDGLEPINPWGPTAV